MKKIILAIVMLVVVAVSVEAQDTFNSLLNRMQYKSAYEEAERMYKAAGNSRALLRATYCMAEASSYYQEYDVANDRAMTRYRAILPRLDSVDRAICYYYLGEYDSAMMDEQVLKRTSSKSVLFFCEMNGDEKGIEMTPTLYDIMLYNIEMQMYDNPQRMVELQRKLVDFHANDGDDIRIYHDIRLLAMMDQVPNSNRVGINTYKTYLNKYRGTKCGDITEFYYRIASRLRADGNNVDALHYCDTAIALFPKSICAVDCELIKRAITRKVIENITPDNIVAYPGMATPVSIQYRNVDHIWFRVVKIDKENIEICDNLQKTISEFKVVNEWDIAVPTNDKYLNENIVFSIPGLKPGYYLLLASPTADFDKGDYYFVRFYCTDMMYFGREDGFIVDRRSGKPVVGQKVDLKKFYYDKEAKTIGTTTTDANGRFSIKTDTDDTYYFIERNGFQRKMSRFIGRMNSGDYSIRGHATFDRPIYRPGDTIAMSFLLYSCNGVDADAVAGQKVNMLLIDPNFKEVMQMDLTTDEFGFVSVRMPLPKDCVPGNWILKTSGGTDYYSIVRIEEYKQPKFMISLDEQKDIVEKPAFGKPKKVKGLATSYNGVPISDARVQYTVTRSQIYTSWRWHTSPATDVVTDETTTKADGSFEFEFIPMPDSSIELSHKPTFAYSVQVTVTDINGESHNQAVTFYIGYNNAVLSLEVEEEETELKSFEIAMTDLNNKILKGKMVVNVDRLLQPSNPLLDNPANRNSKLYNTIDNNTWLIQFPLYARDADYNNPESWPIDKVIASSTVDYDGTNGVVKMPELQSGVYRIMLSAAGADTIVRYVVLTKKDAHKAQSQKLVWLDMDKASAEVGDVVNVRIGTRFSNVEVYYMIHYRSNQYTFNRLTLSDEIKTIPIKVDSSMLGNFSIEVIAAKENVLFHESKECKVDFTHKKLKVEIATFRDKLLPGEQEQWTVKVSGEKDGLPRHSALVLGMYDDALNSYGKGENIFKPWLTNNLWQFSIYDGYPLTYNLLDIEEWDDSYSKQNATIVWLIKPALALDRRAVQYAIRRNKASANWILSDDIEAEESYSVVTCLEVMDYKDMAGTAYNKSDITEYEEIMTGSESAKKTEIRTNLSTVAFFAPDLRTNDSGEVTYKFTVPELLTKWNVKGLAVTKDISIGTLDKSLVTKKQLMIQPNMPRFLRHGDKLSLMAKVMNLTDNNADCNVSLLLTDAATGDTISLQQHPVRVVAHGNGRVMFDIEVPHNVYVATYKIIAQADGMSDGEQAQIPVVSSRQAVTVSQAMYINGIGEKKYQINDAFSAVNDTRELRLLAVEAVSDPIWLAIKAMPYLKETESPSNIYLANQIYVNTLGRKVMDYFYIDFTGTADTVSVGTSRLGMNEDVKQTLLSSTPWLSTALSEEQQRRDMRIYFDSARLSSSIDKSIAQLLRQQQNDGGWSWMPDGGRSSLYITGQILKRLSVIKGNADVDKAVKKALKYVDKEIEDDYEKNVKPIARKYKDYNPVYIDYLYTRSLYGKANTEAYRFYYNNAKKNYKSYNCLLSQAQLALIYNRHGDTKQARTMINYLKQKSLENDEMGVYWRDNRSGWFWYQRPVETQALLIQAFSEVTPQDTNIIGQMQQWLLKQKQTTNWGNDQSTIKAIDALMIGRRGTISRSRGLEVSVFGQKVTAEAQGKEGYISQRWSGEELEQVTKSQDSDITVRKTTPGIAWGAAYMQFIDEMDKVPNSESGMTIKRFYVMQSDGSSDAATLKVGDKVTVRLEISCDRNMDYIEIIDGRPSCVEPVSTQAGWRWSLNWPGYRGLSYYIMVNNTDTRCYVEHLDKGKYIFTYDVYVTNPGLFLAGPATIQCMYAPEFRATVPGTRLKVE